MATGIVPVALGQDGGGSIRIPAAWSGTVGLAVGYGRIPFRKGKENIFTVKKPRLVFLLLLSMIRWRLCFSLDRMYRRKKVLTTIPSMSHMEAMAYRLPTLGLGG